VFGYCPSTVIAQAENIGQVRVLAAFASDGMSLRRHIETTVRPWLAAVNVTSLSSPVLVQ